MAVLGPNGAGKSTLLLHLNGLLPERSPSPPSIWVQGEPLTEKNLFWVRQRVGLLFQDPDDQLVSATVFEDVAFGPLQLGVSGDELKQLVASCLESVGLAGFEGREPHRLSQGEKRRVCLAGVLACKPAVLVLDEPTSGVDPVARREFWDLIYEMAAGGTTIFITTHYMDEAEHCNRVAFMYRSKLMALDTPAGLKSTYLHGAAWDLAANPLLETVEELSHTEGVAQASLHGDRAHVILDTVKWSPENLTKYLLGKGIPVNSIETVQSTLEDVFTLLAHRGKENALTQS
jgi:energy-coupling factor transporter ATP-binding protein EcfA2